MHDRESLVAGNKSSGINLGNISELFAQVSKAVEEVQIYDVHTHLYSHQFGVLNLWGIDELLNYHYLIAEFFRSSPMKPEKFFGLEKEERSNLIWQTLFVENTPLSEAACGIITVLNELGLNTKSENLEEARQFFQSQRYENHLENVLKVAGVSDIVMTNDPLDEQEISIWENGIKIDSRFHAALRLDRLLNDWANAALLIKKQGYPVSSDSNDQTTIRGTRLFLEDWTKKMNPLYLAVSLENDFAYPESGPRGIILEKVILPFCRDHQIPLSLMIGVRRQINPNLGLAGDGLGRADVSAVSRICEANPEVRFLATFLSLENQHEFNVVARKFANLMPFGCWWFLNNPSIISEITKNRLELLGTSFIAQHSDARILEQLIYKWKHSRRAITIGLFESYKNLYAGGRTVDYVEIERDVKKIFSNNFQSWINPKK